MKTPYRLTMLSLRLAAAKPLLMLLNGFASLPAVQIHTV